MNYTVIKKLPCAEDIIHAIPLSYKNQRAIQAHRREIKSLLLGSDSRLLIIVGPCSAWPKEAVLEYAERLAVLNTKVKHALKLVMRVYTQKPRTTTGWTGTLYQPDPLSVPDVEAGLRYARQTMIGVIDLGLAIGAEALFTHHRKGFLELLSWVAIGARSSENPEHRMLASSVDIPVGLKNPTHGSLMAAVNSVLAAQSSHTAVLEGAEIKTQGNPYAHLVLRGGNNVPNYSLSHLSTVNRLLEMYGIKHPAILIDVSHENSIRQGIADFRLQEEIVFTIIESLKDRPDLKKRVKGFMLESFLKEGKQKIDLETMSIDLGGLSITDPCLGWEQTEKLLLVLSEAHR